MIISQLRMFLRNFKHVASLLEMQLQHIIQNEYPDNSWTYLLKLQRLKNQGIIDCPTKRTLIA